MIDNFLLCVYLTFLLAPNQTIDTNIIHAHRFWSSINWHQNSNLNSNQKSVFTIIPNRTFIYWKLSFLTNLCTPLHLNLSILGCCAIKQLFFIHVAFWVVFFCYFCHLLFLWIVEFHRFMPSFLNHTNNIQVLFSRILQVFKLKSEGMPSVYNKF